MLGRTAASTGTAAAARVVDMHAQAVREGADKVSAILSGPFSMERIGAAVLGRASGQDALRRVREMRPVHRVDTISLIQNFAHVGHKVVHRSCRIGGTLTMRDGRVRVESTGPRTSIADRTVRVKRTGILMLTRPREALRLA